MSYSAPESNTLPPGPNYWMIFGFEEHFDVPKSIQFFNDYAHMPFILTIGVYLSALHFGQKIMTNREPIEAKKTLVMWNFGLGIFSMMGFVRVFPEMLYTYRNFGFEYTICKDSYFQVKPAAFWTYLFVLSKTLELMDTIFLVMRKKKLRFLHVFHHSTVLIYTWFVYADKSGGLRWFTTMNFGIHSIMYTYYALKALPNLIRIPRWVSMLITSSQILQMACGSFVIASIVHIQLNDRPCDATMRTAIISLVITTSYLLLFSYYFYKAYCCPVPQRSARVDKKRA